MHCPFCGQADSKVIDSRESSDGVRRRRECLGCGMRFTTYERIHALPLMVIKRDGRREAFSTEKLVRSVRLACAKRPLEIGSLEKLTLDVENEVHRLGRAEVESRIIGEMVMERLMALDRVAYIRFASVYRDFEDIDTFAREVEALRDEDGRREAPSNQLPLIPDDVPRLEGRRRRRQAPAAPAAPRRVARNKRS
ncbi:MAG: transcriptional repressor NrdR [Chloroflexi bacterium]|nr:transcriptional repressor NrdR [Chloroflexota bacterium]